MAKKDVDVYVAPPVAVGAPATSLQKKTVIQAGTWVTTGTGIVMARRHPGQVDKNTTLHVDKDPTYHGVINLTKGQAISLYSYLGENCWTSWAEGHLFSFCNATAKGQPQNEWWIQIKMSAII